jgi:hypothetical protein
MPDWALPFLSPENISQPEWLVLGAAVFFRCPCGTIAEKPAGAVLNL